MITCLVVDDDPASRESIRTELERYGFKVRIAESAQAMHGELGRGGIDMILMAHVLPDADGIELCREFRVHSDIPLIILSEEIDQITRIIGFEIGVDDFVMKPPDCRELIARIRSLTRRTIGLRATVPGMPSTRRSNSDTPLQRPDQQGGGWRVCWRSRSVQTPWGLSIPLSNTELQLVVAFVQSPGTALSREQLAERTQQSDDERGRRNIDLRVSRLRAKLGDTPGNPTFLRTIRGFGYQLISAEAAALAEDG